MKSTLKSEITRQEAHDTVVITEQESRAIAQLVDSLHHQTVALKAILVSSGIESWLSNAHPRSLANLDIKVTKD